MDNQNIYQFNAEKIGGDAISLGNYRNKVLLIVNIASQCGFTPQLKELAALKKEFAGHDFEILAFPSNDFGGQEPLEGAAIEQFCGNYGNNFPVFEKIRVRGPYANPLYKFLSDKKENGKVNSAPRWNFHKYLISRAGAVADYFYPFTTPTSSKVRKSIQRLLLTEVNR